MIKWPRGKYNGQRIVGYEIGFRINISWWNWLPKKPYGQGLLHWFCFTFKFDPVYSHE
jgi:hypothetical protein